MVRHSRRVRYIGGAFLRAAWTALNTMPSGLRKELGIGRWHTTVGEWAWCHSIKCECQSCGILLDSGIYKSISEAGDKHYDSIVRRNHEMRYYGDSQ